MADLPFYIDPELIAPLQAMAKRNPGGFDLNDISKARREYHQTRIEASQDIVIEGVSVDTHELPGLDGEPDVPVRIYCPEGLDRDLPAVLWIHGGGYVLGCIEEDDVSCKTMALGMQCVVVSVEYRLSPEHPYPAAINDCYAALRWLSNNASELSVDPKRIGLIGGSAGGGLTAGLSLMIRDRGEFSVGCQVLYFPMLDDRNVEQASDTTPDALVWDRESNLIGWRSYLGGEPGGPDVPPYAAAARATDLSNLPPTYIVVGGLDLFLDEDIEFARRLMAAGVTTELHVFPGAYHAWGAINPMAEISQQTTSSAFQFVTRHLAAV